ncbi:hypothetical protein B7O87_09190 [Cylindrospermopsis raciborskii CENA303]|uniref:Uncharacterized protein n=1 Tax=Cylindrospermopsis raciborskii CENA303 TaxID=1170769 RepID=A0A1X4G7H7_9CYAN|nr:hypothetical protein [Cylindrospermopsis raciborskii]OSO90959.1 hypothetical protein B7O87_09190 [Cylindrospermopsis raciborskii CENA303]
MEHLVLYLSIPPNPFKKQGFFILQNCDRRNLFIINQKQGMNPKKLTQLITIGILVTFITIFHPFIAIALTSKKIGAIATENDLIRNKNNRFTLLPSSSLLRFLPNVL